MWFFYLFLACVQVGLCEYEVNVCQILQKLYEHNHVAT